MDFDYSGFHKLCDITQKMTDEERSKNYFSKLERELDEHRIFLKARAKRLTPGILVKVNCSVSDSSSYEKRLNGSIGMVLGLKYSGYNSSMFRILIDDKIVVLHSLDLEVIETEPTEETHNE